MKMVAEYSCFKPSPPANTCFKSQVCQIRVRVYRFVLIESLVESTRSLYTGIPSRRPPSTLYSVHNF
jgi:hypothetical protein